MKDPYVNVGAGSYCRGPGPSSFGSLRVGFAVRALVSDARGSNVRELPEPLPVYAWFQLPDHLLRRSDTHAYRLSRDAVWGEAGRDDTKLAA